MLRATCALRRWPRRRCRSGQTHGRAETEGPGRAVRSARTTPPHQGHAASTLDEFDIDAIFARRPRVVLIDEFAHPNAPGRRHPKRWHDIVELRDAGIDVRTTLNIQHVESLGDVVAEITGIRSAKRSRSGPRPADEIELVNLPRTN